MPGQTNNDIAIDALNQAIVALNELAAQFNTGGADPNSLAANLELVAENIDATRVALETGQTAAIVAQNTNFSDLIAALQAGCLTKYITIQRGMCGGGGIFMMGTEPPSDSGIQFGTPPGYFQPTDEAPQTAAYYSRKCKVANATHDSYREWLQGWIDQGIDSILDLQIATLGVLMGLALGAVLTPVPFLDEAVVVVVGIVAEVALAYISLQGEIDLQGIINIMDAHRDQLVCVLFDSESATQAQNDYMDILSANGASVGDIALMRAMMVYDVLNNLFFKSSEAIEAGLAAYTPPSDCTSCNCQMRYRDTEDNQLYSTWPQFAFGDTMAAHYDDTGQQYPGYYVVVSFDDLYNISLTITSGTFTPIPQLDQTGKRAVRGGSGVCANYAGQYDVIDVHTFQSLIDAVGNITLNSQTVFSVRVELQ